MRTTHRWPGKKRGSLLLLAACAATFLSACHYFHKKPDKPDQPDKPPCTEPAIDPDRSLVVHDPALLATPFALRKTLQAVIDTSGLGATTPEALLKTMVDSFSKSSFVHPKSGKTIPVTPRPQEAALSPAELLDPTKTNGMIPIGLFNRLDLAPKDGRHCGEYRIVYAVKQPHPTGNRFLIIFEAALPNPDPASGIAACQPVAQFWADLSTDPSPASRIAKLESFYYVGLSGFRHVVEYANYGVPFGQVRTNLFVEKKWMLREHRTDMDQSATVPAFTVDTVKETPLVEWFRVPGGLPPGITVADQQAFRTHFLNEPVCNLVRPERVNPSASQFDVVNGIGSKFDPAGDDFQSVSQGPEDDPATTPDPAIVSAIGTRLTALGIANTAITPTNVLHRSGAMTCGGCHQFSNGKPLDAAGTKLWPSSAGFVHIKEDGGLSPALTGFFLPARQKNLARFLCDPTPVATPGCEPAPADTGKRPYAGTAAPPARPQLAVELIKNLTEGREALSYKTVDDARLVLYALHRRMRTESAGASRTAARDEARRIRKLLEAAIERARDDERAQPGAFTPARRPH